MAVVGLAGRFPGARDVELFWKNILADVDAIVPLPEDRLNQQRYYDPEIGAYGKSYSRKGGLVDPLDGDPSRGKLSRDALAAADVAHLLALEVARSALEDAGYDPFGLERKNVGVIVGHARGSMLLANQAFATGVEAMLLPLREHKSWKALTPEARQQLEAEIVKTVRARYPYPRPGDVYSGASASGLASLIARTFGFTGRQMVVDAACASSFAALEIAIEALAQGKLDAAVVGGASYSQELSVIMFAQSRALSPDGSFPFDQRANGFISSDGFGLLVLRRLEDALRDGNRIRAVIRGIGGSCDGKGKALWAPRREGQVLAIQRAYAQCGVDPASIELLEAHATSTPLGDRTELEALHECFAKVRGGRPLPIGSVKGNIGHAREAAGVAGLIKVISALEQATLPPTGNFRTPSQEIPWKDLAVEVLTAPRPWNTTGVRRAAVDAFGIGGLNYHVIVEEAPPERRAKVKGPKLERTSAPSQPRDIAIVGLGMRLPGATQKEAFWRILERVEDVTIEAPPERWKKEIYLQPGERMLHRTYGARGAFLTGFVADWRRYQVPPKLVERNDPLQFQLLESALDAMEDAGLDPAQVDRGRIATIVGSVFGSDYALELALAIRAEELAEVTTLVLGKRDDKALKAELLEVLRKPLPTINEDSSGSFSSSTLASRTSKQLDLMGPTYSIDASDASSLASLEAACELLRGGSADWVVWGGGERSMRAQRFEYLSFNGVLSKNGTPHPYDQNADGFLPGEGAGVCVLRRLEDALANGERIHAVIKGVGSASDREVRGAPGLEVAIERATSEAGPSTVGYVEGYGAGIPAIDQAEVTALRHAYGEQRLVLGSAASTFGHTNGAAGVIATQKATLVLEKGTVPPTRGFESPAPSLELGSIRLPRSAEPIDAPRAAVSVLGGNGASYHVVLERAGQLPDGVFKVAASDLEGLKEQLGTLEASRLYKERSVGAGPVVLGLTALDEESLGRTLKTVLQAGLTSNTQELREKQGAFLIADRPASPERVAFLFSGQGSQYPGMMRAFRETVPAAKQLLDAADEWHLSRGLPAISTVMTSGAPIPADVYWVQACVLIGDLMAHAAVRSLGLVPKAVTGHSFGDYAALVAAGAWTLETALEATRRRAAAIGATTVKGGMIAVSAGKDRVLAALGKSPTPLAVEIANENAIDQVVLAGPLGGLDAVEAYLTKEGLEPKRLEVPGPFHSSWMGEAKSELEKSLLDLPIHPPERPYLSSITGRFETDPERIRAALIAQLVEPVRWAQQIEVLLADGIDVFIECGPKAVLTGLTRRALVGKPAQVVPSDDAQRPGRWSLAKVATLLEARRASRSAATSGAPEPTSESQLPLLIGAAADRLSQEPGFAEFWARTQPTVAALVEGLWAAERTRTAIPAPAPVTEAPSPEPIAEAPAFELAPVPGQPTRAEVQAFLLDAICKESGYPPEIVGLDADLEADLGIDTVKQAQVLGRVRDKFNLRTEQKLSLRDFPTLRHILDYVEKNLAARAEEPVRRRPKVPVLDLTARRSQRPEAAPLPAPLPVPATVTSPPPAAVAPATAAPAPRPVAAPTITVVPTTNGHVAKNGNGTGSIYPLPAPPRRDASPVERVTVLELKGTSRAIGRQHGEALRDSILEVLDRYQRFLGDRGDTLLALPGAMERLRASFDVASLDELAGIAEGVGVPVDYLLAYNLDAALFPALTPGCTQAVRLARHNEGRLLHLVNEDSPLLLHLGGGLPRVVQVRVRTDGPRPSRRVVLFSLAGQLAGPNGVTSEGLTVTSTTLLDAPEPEGLPEGSPHPQIVKQILEEADDLESARAKVLRAKRAGRWSVLLSDAETDRAHYLEYDAGTILRDEPIEDRRTTANHALAGPAKGAIAPEHSCLRAQRLENLLGEGSCTPERAQTALRDRYDLGRHRVVTHPTMNTVRRVDNVMSLVVEPKARRLTVSDRVLAPGTAETEDVGFLTLEYGDRPAPVELEPIHGYSPEGAGVVRLHEVMDRHVVRPVELTPPPADPRRRFGRGLLVGTGPLAEALAEVLAPRFEVLERAHDPVAALALLSHGGAARYQALGLLSGADPSPPEEALRYPDRRERFLTAPFRVLRAFAEEDRPGLLFGVSSGGGLFGFDNAKEATGETLGLSGMLKAIRHERKGLTIRAFDTSPTDGAGPQAELIARFLDGDGPLEIGLLRGKAFGLGLQPTSAPAPVGGPLPRSWVISGGARGVTAKIALRLAELYRPRLYLLGRQVLPEPGTVVRWRQLDAAGLDQERRALAGPNATPLAFKAVAETIDKVREIDANLRALAATGAHVEYVAVDVADRNALAPMLERIRKQGPIEGLIHGAGVELAKALEKKTDPLFEATIHPKVDGLVNLLALTMQDDLQQVLAFSSVSGRFGGHGQVDYAAANEALFGVLAHYRARHPGKRATVIAWPAFDEVGMAARSSSRIFLERAGQAFMSPAEGANHLVRELWAGLPETQVVIAGELSALDLDGTMVPAAERAQFREEERRQSARPFRPRPILRSAARSVDEVVLDAAQPYLAHHRIGTTPILPAVVGTELLFGLAQAGAPASLRDLSIKQPLKFPAGSKLPVTLTRSGDQLTLAATPRRPDGVVLEPGRVFFEAFRTAPRVPNRVVAVGQGELVPYPYPSVPDPTPGSRLIFHDLAFRTLRGVRPGTDCGTASLLAPDPALLIPGSDPTGWRLPVAVLDGCLQAIGLLGRLLYGTFALPAGFARLDVDPEALPQAGEPLEAAIQFVAHEPTRLVANLCLSGPRGVILSLERYEAKGATT